MLCAGRQLPTCREGTALRGFRKGVLRRFWKVVEGMEWRPAPQEKEGRAQRGRVEEGESQELWAVLQDRSAREGGDHGPVLEQWGAMEGSGERWGQSASLPGDEPGCVLGGVGRDRWAPVCRFSEGEGMELAVTWE